MTPVFLKKIFKEKYSKPVNKKLFGTHKTWRGLIGGTILGTIIFLIQKILYNKGIGLSLSLINYNNYSILLGFLLAFGALLGDLLESYIKRISKIKEGKPFFPWDQLDYIIGALILSFIIFIPSLTEIIFIIIISFLLHIIVHYLGYLLKIRKSAI
jgi:CDP-2,3-bis-(O-geranylgeranyl)-sn-glycerol synthase